MALENRTWGAEWSQGELLKLGISVAKRTVERHMKVARPSGGGQTWATFVKTHGEVLQVAVTRSPSATWTAQQLHEITPFGERADVIIRDRGGHRYRCGRAP